MIRIHPDALSLFFQNVFTAEGFSAEQAAEIADVLLTADLYGILSHGAQRLMYYHRNIESGSVDRTSVPEILQETPVSMLVDGHFGMGQCVASFAMRHTIEKAQKMGICITAVRNSSHFGIAGYYTNMALEAGLAGFAMTNTGPIMVPTFGKEMILGTNPIAFAMAADPYPFWFDASTTVVPLGKVELREKTGQAMPEGWVIDGFGDAQTDASMANHGILNGEDGGILPLGGAGEILGGHKGYGLAIMVEALTGVLSGGLLSPEMLGPHGDHTSHFFLVFNPALFGDPEAIRSRLSGYLCALRQSRKVPGENRIYTPGEKARESEQRCRRQGIPIDPGTYAEMQELADLFGIPMPEAVPSR